MRRRSSGIELGVIVLAKLSVIQAVNQALMQEMEANDKVVVLGEDVGKEGGVFRATEGLQAKFGTQRVIDTPLAENSIIGLSVGMAMEGLKPVAEIQFSGFLQIGYNQIMNHIGRMRNRTRGKYTTPVVIRTPHGGGIRALEHHCECVEAIYAHLPGIRVFAPATPYDAKGMLAEAIQSPDPTVILEPTRLYRAVKDEVPESRYIVPAGEARIAVEGKHVTLVSWGPMVRTAVEVANQARAEGIEVEVIDLRSITPLDSTGLIEKSVQKTGRLVVAQEAPRTAGFAAEVVTQVVEKSFDFLQAKPMRVTGYDSILPLGTNEDLYIPDTFRLFKAIRQSVSY